MKMLFTGFYFNGGLPDVLMQTLRAYPSWYPARRVNQREKRKHESAVPSPSPVVYDQLLLYRI
jgi:hypothetical protein